MPAEEFVLAQQFSFLEEQFHKTELWNVALRSRTVRPLAITVRPLAMRSKVTTNFYQDKTTELETAQKITNS